MSKKTHYDAEFKAGAIQLALSSDKPASHVAKELGIDSSVLYSWLKKERQPQEVKAAMEHLKQQEAEIKQLKRQLKRMTDERDILKKAMAYFAKDPE